MSPNRPITGVALAIGNLRKNVVEENRASSNLSILSVINEADGRGITGESATGIGVYGFSHSSTGIEGYSPYWFGVYGRSETGWGMYGYSDNTGAILGDAASTTGDVDGVTGIAASTFSYRPPVGVSSGVVGSVTTAGDYGVFGSSADTTGQSYGVVGLAAPRKINLAPRFARPGRTAQDQSCAVTAHRRVAEHAEGYFGGRREPPRPLWKHETSASFASW